MRKETAQAGSQKHPQHFATPISAPTEQQPAVPYGFLLQGVMRGCHGVFCFACCLERKEYVFFSLQKYDDGLQNSDLFFFSRKWLPSLTSCLAASLALPIALYIYFAHFLFIQIYFFSFLCSYHSLCNVFFTPLHSQMSYYSCKVAQQFPGSELLFTSGNNRSSILFPISAVRHPESGRLR